MRRSIITSALLSVFLIGSISWDVDACPNCKDSVATASSESTGAGESNAALSGGFNTSIYVMLSAFVGVLGFVGFTLYRGSRAPR